MRKSTFVLCLLLGLCSPFVHGQQASTKHTIAYTWDPGKLTLCPSGTTTSCVKDYVFTLTDPTGAAALAPLTIAYSSSAYTFAPGGFLYCGDWKVSLAIEYYNDASAAQTTTPATLTTSIACPFVASPPTGLKGTPGA